MLEQLRQKQLEAAYKRQLIRDMQTNQPMKREALHNPWHKPEVKLK